MNLESKVLSMHNKNTPIEEIALSVNEPIAIVEELIDNQLSTLETESISLLNLEDLSEIHSVELKAKILACTNHLVDETIKNVNNEFVLNRIGKTSQILKNLSDTAANNADSSRIRDNKFSKYFKA